MAMTQEDMQGALNSLRGMTLGDVNSMINFMQETHEADHTAVTHTRPGGVGDVKSFYMRKAMVTEQQGTRLGQVGWNNQQGQVPNLVTVRGYDNATRQDEANIVKSVARMSEYMLIDATDTIGGKFLLVTAIPNAYSGWTYSGGNTLPQQVYMNVLVVRAATNTKFLSTYPASADYVHTRPGAAYTVA